VPKAEDNAVAQAASVAKPPIDMELDPKPTPEPIPAPVATAVVAPPPALPDEETDDEPARPSKPPPIGKRRDERPTTRRERPAPAASGSSTGMIVLILLLLGGGLFGCVGCLGGLGWWAYAVNEKPRPVAKGDNKEKEKAKVDDKAPDQDVVVKKNDDNQPPLKFPPGGINIVVPANGTYRDNNSLTQFDKVDFGNKRKKVYTVHMVEGQTYQIDLCSDAFDSYLYLYDNNNVLLAQDDDGGGFPDARIVFRAPRTGFYRIHASHFGAQNLGNYSLFVRRSVNGEIIHPPFP
jgi:hypothetical protein